MLIILVHQLDQTDKATLQEKKIRVIWLAAEDSSNGPSASAVASTPSRHSVVNGVSSPLGPMFSRLR